MPLTRRTLLTLAGSAAFAGPLAAQDWPTRPIRFMVGTLAGGSADVIARVIADPLVRDLTIFVSICARQLSLTADH